MKVLIIGANGQLGQEFQETIPERDPTTEVAALTHEQVEVAHEGSVRSAIIPYAPDWVINCAAYHKVDDCERFKGTAFGTNAVGAHNVAAAAREVDAKVVFISTDYVFGGSHWKTNAFNRPPYTEGDHPWPLNVYGVSKVAGEKMTQLANPDSLIVRTAGLYGKHTSRKGWTFPEMMLERARAGQDIRVVNDQVLSPTWTRSLAIQTYKLMENNTTGLAHITNSGECSWWEFTRYMFDILDMEVEIEAVKSSAFPSIAARPCYSALSSVRVGKVISWRQALVGYLEEKGEL